MNKLTLELSIDKHELSDEQAIELIDAAVSYYIEEIGTECVLPGLDLGEDRFAYELKINSIKEDKNKLSGKYSEQAQNYLETLKKVEALFPDIEPSWDPEGSWLPLSFDSKLKNVKLENAEIHFERDFNIRNHFTDDNNIEFEFHSEVDFGTGWPITVKYNESNYIVKPEELHPESEPVKKIIEYYKPNESNLKHFLNELTFLADLCKRHNNDEKTQ